MTRTEPIHPACSRAPVLLSLGLLLTIVVAPGEFGSVFGGPPLGVAARWWVVGLIWLGTGALFVRPPRRFPWSVVAALAGLLAVKVWIASGSVAYGWLGTYEMVDEPAKTARFAWRLRTHDYRIDPRIAFDEYTFALNFLNDAPRYGHQISPETRQVSVPLRIRWRGYAALPTAAPVSVVATAQGAVTVLIDGQPLLVADSPVNESSTTLGPWPAGPVRFEVIYEKPSGASPEISVRLTSPVIGEFAVRPFADSESLPAPAANVVPDPSAEVTLVATGLLLAGLLGAYVGRPRAPGSGELGASVAKAAVLVAFGVLLLAGANNAIPYRLWTFHLWSGDDPLVYVSNARSVLLDGWLMTDGYPVGQGQPFYHYPLFAYVIGAAQWVIGEDYSVVRLVNGWFVALLVPLAWALGWRTRPWWAATVGVASLGWLIYHHMLPFALIGYTDSIFTGVVFIALVLCVRALDGAWWHAVAAGMACALAAATRPSFLTFTPLFLIAIAVAWRPASLRRRVAIASLVLAGFVAGLLPFAVRNAIMSGKLVVLVSSWIQIPFFLIPPEVTPNPVPAMFAGTPSLWESVAAAARIVASDPVGVVGLELRKVAFTLGVTHWGMPGGSVLHPEFLVLSGLFALVVVLRRLPANLLLVVGVFVTSHVAAMVLAAPWTYGYKTILPLHAVFLFCAVYLLPGRPATATAAADRSAAGA